MPYAQDVIPEARSSVKIGSSYPGIPAISDNRAARLPRESIPLPAPAFTWRGPADRVASLLGDGRRGVERHSGGLLFEAEVPRLEWFWDLTDARGNPGQVRWSAYSFALQQYIGIAVVDRRVEYGEVLTVEHPRGDCRAEVRPLPFVERSA